MKKQDILSIAITFVIGMLAGGYLYLVGFAPQFDKLTGQTASDYNDLVVEGNMYGGFRSGTPPSFQIMKDGSFRYLPLATGDEAVVAKEGVVPGDLWTAVKADLTSSELYLRSQTVTPATCASYVDGIDYRYDITLNNVIYMLDTCGTDFTSDSAVALSLEKLWAYFETVE